MERRPRGIIINPNPDEGTTSVPTLYDAAGRPMRENADAAIIHTSAPDRTIVPDALVPSLAEASRKFVEAGIELNDGRLGELTLATNKPKKIELVGADSAPEELRGNEPIVEDYFDFPPELIASVLEAHKSGKINLYSGDKKQFAVYITRIMRASGLTSERGAYKLIPVCLGKSAVGVESLKDYFTSGQTTYHPRASWVVKTAGGRTWQKKVYEEGDESYDNLALTLLPEIWNSMDSSQKGQLIKSLLILHEVTTNFRVIDAARLHERLAEICANEKEMSLRYNIYAILDAVPSESLTAIAKNNLAGAMMRYNDFGTDLSFSLLRESEEISLKKPPVDIGASGLEKLWPVYKKYEQRVLDKLSQPLVELAMTDDMEWVKLLDSVTRLSPYALIDSSETKKEEDGVGHFGLELEFAPLDKDPYVTSQDFTDALTISKNADGNSLRLLTEVDQDCAEVRTDVGGELLDAATLHRLQTSFRSLQHTEPMGWWATMHVHIDEGTCSSKRMIDIYADLNTNTEHHTHEIRSFPAPNFYADGPTQGPELNRVSIARLAYLVKCGLASRYIPDNVNTDNEVLTNMSIGSLNADARLRRLLAISLCGDDPRQRAAALYTAHTSPMFLDHSYILSVIDGAKKDNKVELLKAGLELLPGDRIWDFINDLLQYGDSNDILAAQELYNSIEDTEIKDYIFQCIANYGEKVCLTFLREHYQEIRSEIAKANAVKTLVKYGNEKEHAMIKELYNETTNNTTKISIVDTVAIHGSDAGVNLLQEWYKNTEDRSFHGKLVRDQIIQKLAEYGGRTALPFLMKHYHEINGINLKATVLLAVAVHGGSNGVPFIEQRYHEIEEDKAREQILEVVIENGGEAGMKAVKKWYSEEEYDEAKSNILQTVLENKGAYAVYELTGDEKWLP